MEYKKYLVFGSGGMLGNEFIKILPKTTLFTDKDVNNTQIEYCDIRNFEHVKTIISDYKPDFIINLAAITDLEYSELNPDDCFLTNTIAAINLFDFAKELDVPYIFISTAGIYGNQKEYYTEDDQPTPLSIYGKSKFFTEQFLLNQNYKKFYIFRAGWMMGGGKTLDKKFINKIYKIIQSGKKELHVVSDKSGVPTFTKDFATSILKHIENGLPYGLYNQVCNGEASRYDVANEMVKHLKLDIKVIEVESDYFKDSYFAERPKSEKLINNKLNNLNMNYMRDWKICLVEYLNEFFL